MKKQDFFFCYNKRLFSFIKDVKGIDYITTAINPKTKKIFTLFYKDDILQAAIDEYKSLDLINRKNRDNQTSDL